MDDGEMDEVIQSLAPFVVLSMVGVNPIPKSEAAKLGQIAKGIGIESMKGRPSDKQVKGMAMLLVILGNAIE